MRTYTSSTHSSLLGLVSPVEPVDLGRLLSMDYQREWLANSRRRDEERRRRARAQRQAQRQKLLEHALHAREVAGLEQPKPRFIMKR